jgi:hypothetical protein
MANADTPFGLRPIKHRNGAPYNGAVNAYYVPASYATALFVGDPVVKIGTSNATNVTAPGAGSFGIGTLPSINKAAAGTTNRITGVIVGFAPDPNGMERIYNPASTERVVYVCDDPDVIFEAQVDGTLTADMIGLNAVLIHTNAGSTTTGRSGTEISIGTAPATTVGFQVNLLRVVNREDNELGEFAKVEVRINTHTETNAVTGI